MAQNIPAHLIEPINKLVRVSRRLLFNLGRIAERVAMPVEKVRKLLEIANCPIVLAWNGEPARPSVGERRRLVR
jgi:DNA-directed RNA polymerase sigma subunit (sigma70/sigma32)